MSPPRQVLVVDDDAADRKNIRRLLRQAGYDAPVVEAASIAEALDRLPVESFLCVIIDYHMPGLDGLGGIAKLHEQTPETPIIMVTGQGDELVASQAYQAGASDYIPKNKVSANALGRSIANSVEKHGMRRQIEEQNASLRLFSKVLAHDLKAPLTTQYGSARLLRHLLQSGDTERALALCKTVERSCERMTMLVDAVSAYNDCTISHPEHVTVSMNAVFDDVVADLALSIAERGADVTRDDLPTVAGVHPRLLQLLQNLVANGLKYCDSVRPAVAVSTRRHGDRTVFTVADNGIGIPEGERDSIFEPFRRASGVRAYEGTGLGLATCRTIVTQHGGRIWCEAGRPGGTVFCFTLE